MCIKYFLAKDYLERREIRLEYMPTDQMVADFFTKPLQGKQFIKHRASIMNLDDAAAEDREDTGNLSLQGCVGIQR
jgi:hypothetical protein